MDAVTSLPAPPVLAASVRLDDYLRQVHAWTVEVHQALQALVDEIEERP